MQYSYKSTLVYLVTVVSVVASCDDGDKQAKVKGITYTYSNSNETPNEGEPNNQNEPPQEENAIVQKGLEQTKDPQNSLDKAEKKMKKDTLEKHHKDLKESQASQENQKEQPKEETTILEEQSNEEASKALLSENNHNDLGLRTESNTKRTYLENEFHETWHNKVTTVKIDMEYIKNYIIDELIDKDKKKSDNKLQVQEVALKELLDKNDMKTTMSKVAEYLNTISIAKLQKVLSQGLTDEQLRGITDYIKAYNDQNNKGIFKAIMSECLTRKKYWPDLCQKINELQTAILQYGSMTWIDALIKEIKIQESLLQGYDKETIKDLTNKINAYKTQTQEHIKSYK